MGNVSIIPKPQAFVMQTGSYLYQPGIKPEKRNRTDIPPEGYVLSVDKDGIRIDAGDEAGFFYGEKTLEQITLQYPKEIPC